MTKSILEKFIMVTEESVEKEYLYTTITFKAAPVLEGKKPSSLITFSKDNKNLYEMWKKYRNEFKKNSRLEYFELRETDKYILVLFYNKEKLNEVIIENQNMNFLRRFGYRKDMKLQESLELLNSRFEEVCPHEMGIFLGYPVKDVISFIKCSGKGCLMCGYWKVYHNPLKAAEIFKAYDKAKENILNLIIKGENPYNLVMA